jgi:hypothetical protein
MSLFSCLAGELFPAPGDHLNTALCQQETLLIGVLAGIALSDVKMGIPAPRSL